MCSVWSVISIKADQVETHTLQKIGFDKEMQLDLHLNTIYTFALWTCCPEGFGRLSDTSTKMPIDYPGPSCEMDPSIEPSLFNYKL